MNPVTVEATVSATGMLRKRNRMDDLKYTGNAMKADILVTSAYRTHSPLTSVCIMI